MSAMKYLLCLLLLASPVLGDTWTDTDAASIVDDSYMWSSKPTLYPYTNTRMTLAGDAVFPNSNKRAFIIEWDLSGTALMGTTINTAKVNFEVRTALGSARSIEARKILRTDMQFSKLSWQYYKNLTPWVGAGASHASDSTAYSPPIALNGPTSTGSWDYTGLAFAVQDAVDVESGFLRIMFRPDLWYTLATDALTVYTKNHATGSSRPTLIVDYTPATSGIVPLRRRIEGHAYIMEQHDAETLWAVRPRHARIRRAG